MMNKFTKIQKKSDCGGMVKDLKCEYEMMNN